MGSPPTVTPPANPQARSAPEAPAQFVSRTDKKKGKRRVSSTSLRMDSPSGSTGASVPSDVA